MFKNHLIEVLLVATGLSVIVLLGGVGNDLRAGLAPAFVPPMTALVFNAADDVLEDVVWHEEESAELGCWNEEQFLYVGEKLCTTDVDAVRCDIDLDGQPVLVADFCDAGFEE